MALAPLPNRRLEAERTPGRARCVRQLCRSRVAGQGVRASTVPGRARRRHRQWGRAAGTAFALQTAAPCPLRRCLPREGRAPARRSLPGPLKGCLCKMFLVVSEGAGRAAAPSGSGQGLNNKRCPDPDAEQSLCQRSGAEVALERGLARASPGPRRGAGPLVQAAPGLAACREVRAGPAGTRRFGRAARGRALRPFPGLLPQPPVPDYVLGLERVVPGPRPSRSAVPAVAVKA